MVTKSANLSKANFSDFFSVLKQNFGNIFLSTFILWLLLVIYESILFLIGQATFFTTMESQSAMILLYVLEIPFLYLFFALSIFYLKKMFYPNLKTKDYFSIGLKLFVIDLIFLLIIGIFSQLFLVYSNAYMGILLGIVSIVSLFLMFSASKTVMKGNVLQNFLNTFKQFSNLKAIGYYFLGLLFALIMFGLQELFIYLNIIPETISLLTMPFALIMMYYLAYHSVKN